MALQAEKSSEGTLSEVIDRVLDKGIVINADITVSLAGVELLGVKARTAMASFETAARYGMELPSGTNMDTDAWKEAQTAKETCPQCDKRVPLKELMNEGCPWCGWQSAKAKAAKAKAIPVTENT